MSGCSFVCGFLSYLKSVDVEAPTIGRSSMIGNR